MEGKLSYLFPRFESFVFVVDFVQCKASYGEAQASNGLIQNTNFISSFLPLLFCQLTVKEAQIRHTSCRNICRHKSILTGVIVMLLRSENLLLWKDKSSSCRVTQNKVQIKTIFTIDLSCFITKTKRELKHSGGSALTALPLVKTAIIYVCSDVRKFHKRKKKLTETQTPFMRAASRYFF